MLITCSGTYRSPDLAIFVSTTTMTKPIALPLVHLHVVIKGACNIVKKTIWKWLKVGNEATCGLHFEFMYIHTHIHVHVHNYLMKCMSRRFEFVSVPLVHPHYKHEFFHILPERPGPLTRSDKVLSGSSWSTLIVAKLDLSVDCLGQ